MSANPHQVDPAVFNATHPLYDKYIAKWIKYLDFYEGQNLEQYVHRHQRESIDSRRDRARRLVYRNFCAPVIDLYAHYIFSKQVARKLGEISIRIKRQAGGQRTPPEGIPRGSLDEEWSLWLHNVDRHGSTMTRFMSDMCRYAQVFGHVFVVVDFPIAQQQFQSDQDRQKAQAQPYLSYYFPTDAPDWSMDEHGELNWIRFREPIEDDLDPFAVKETHKRRQQVLGRADIRFRHPHQISNYRDTWNNLRYITWTRTHWYVHEIQEGRSSLTRSGRHNMGIVPVILVYNRETARNDFIGQSLISDIADLNQSIMNLDSLIDESIYQSVLSILVMGRQQDTRQSVTLSAKKVLEYDGDRPPFFISPSTAPLSFMEDRITRFSESINRLAKLGGGLGLQPRSVPSGVALSFEFNETNSVLSERADQLEAAEYKIHTLWYYWLGGEFHGTIDYPDDFEVKSFNEELNLLTAGQGVIRSGTYQREMEKRVAARILKSENEDIREQVNREIDAQPSQYEIQQYQQSQQAAGQGGGPPPAQKEEQKPGKTEKAKPAPRAKPEPAPNG